MTQMAPPTPLAEGDTLPVHAAALLRDRMRLDEAKAHLASVPPARRSAVAKRALALHLQRRAGKGPSTYLSHIFGTPKALSTKGPDEIA
jgi:hypothetical protein